MVSEGKLRADGARILRACVVQEGKVLEEQRLKPKAPLTIGHGPKNTFTLNDPSLPKSHTLFQHKGAEYELVFTESMRGKVSDQSGGAAIDLVSLKSQGLAKKKGDTYHFPLNDGHRGMVIIGECRVIFQFVVPPPAPAKPQLPAAARGSLWQQIDWPFAAALAAMFALETPIVIGFSFVEPPQEVTLDDLSQTRWAELVVPELKPQKAPEPEEGEGAAAKKQDTDTAKKDRGDADENPADAAKAKAARREKLREQIAGKGILAVLGAAGEGSTGGAVADVFGQGSGLGGDLDSAFDGIAGVGLASANSGRTTRGGGSGEAASIGGLATAGGGNVGLQGKEERRVASVKASAPQVDGSLDSGEIARVVRGRMRSIQDCYEKELKRDPSLQGKIEIEFTIDSEGRVEDASVASNKMGSEAVGDCIVSRIKRWRFPKPDGGSVTVAYPFIFTASS